MLPKKPLNGLTQTKKLPKMNMNKKRKILKQKLMLL